MSERILLFDVETTGKVDFKKPVHDPCQPRIVQLAALLIEDNKEAACLNVIIEPNGYLIPHEASIIHGITTKHAEEVGMPIIPVMMIFNRLVRDADWIVGHNVSFDILCAQVELHKLQYPNPFMDKPTFCTMRSSTDICKLPGQYGYKWPKLAEVYGFAFNESMVGAHDAMFDLRATLRVYNWLKDKLAQSNVEGVPA